MAGEPSIGRRSSDLEAAGCAGSGQPIPLPKTGASIGIGARTTGGISREFSANPAIWAGSQLAIPVTRPAAGDTAAPSPSPSASLNPGPQAGPPGREDRHRTFILSHIRLVRDALTWTLSRERRLRVVGAADPSGENIADAMRANPDVVLIDMSAPRNFAAARAIAAALPPIKMVAFGIAELDDDVLACAQSGMAGYISRDGQVSDLVNAIERAMQDELSCSPRIAAMLFRRAAATDPGPVANPDHGLLSRREHEIGQLIERGLSNKEIANALGLSAATVKNHVHNILIKLQVRRRGAAAAMWRRA